MRTHAKTLIVCALLAAASTSHAQTSALESRTFSNPQVLGFQARDGTFPVCCQPQLSQDGRFVLFVTIANNLVAGDHNNNQDVFVRDRMLGTTTRANVRSDGNQGRSGDAASAAQAAISADGDLVVFSSRQFDLVASDTNLVSDVFIHRRSTGVTTRINGPGGVQPDSSSNQPSLSGDGRFIVFVSDATNLLPGVTLGGHVYLLDRNSGSLERINVTPAATPSAGGADAPGVSDDGRFVIFTSSASDLVAAGGSGTQLFVRDRQLGLTRRLSESAGEAATSVLDDAMISGDGSRVSFTAVFSDYPVQQVFVADVASGLLSTVSVDNAGNSGVQLSSAPSISRDGQRVAFSSRAGLAGGGLLGSDLLYVRDLMAGSTSLLLTANPSTSTSEPRMSGDGQAVSFSSFANDLVSGDSNSFQDQFVRDVGSGQTSRISLADSSGPFPASGDGTSVLGTTGTRQLSTDGRFIVTATRAKNLGNGVAGLGDQIVHIDRVGNVVRHVSTSVAGPVANSSAFEPAISADGRFVVFRSGATNLVSGDSNSAADVFWRDMENNLLERVSLGPANIQALGAGGTAVSFPTISDDGNLIAYTSSFTNLVPDDTNNARDIFVRDRTAGSTTRLSVDSVGMQANSASEFPVISANGRYAVFTSLASNLVAGDSNALQDIFRHDRQSGVTELISLGVGGAPSNGNSFVSAISADGNLIAFSSSASNLVSGDSNARTDIFVRDVSSGITTRASVSSSGVQGNGTSAGPSLSADGRWSGFLSNSNNLVVRDSNNKDDVFLHDRQTGNTSRVSVDPDGRQVTASFEAVLAGQLSPDGSRVAIDTTARALELVSGKGAGVLMATPVAPANPEHIFQNSFE